jgi:AcrR family transcriptional regulator
MNSTDRRVRRTQKLLGDALIALALEKEYDAITIQDITDRADIGYRTFFRHYADKDELLKDVLRPIREEMRELMAPPSFEYFSDPNVQVIDLPDGAVLFQHVQENSDLYRVLLFSNRGLVQPLKVFVVQEFKANFGALLDTDIPFNIIANHLISAMITLLRWWLENDMCYSPEEMGEYAFQLIIQPVRDLVLNASSEALSE